MPYSKPQSILFFFIKYPRTVISLFFGVFESAQKIVPFYSLKYPLVLFRAVNLLFSRGFEPQEALHLGLLETDFPKTELCKFTSKREMARIQRSLNPWTWVLLTEEKGIFYKYCKASGIPVPELYAIFFRDVSGYTTKGAILRTRDDWIGYINSELSMEFIIKPAHGAYGAGVRCFTRTREDKFYDALSGDSYKAEDIYDIMYSYSGDNSFVIQERLRNHPELKRLSDTDSLQTVRVLTFVDRNVRSHILYAEFKSIVGQNVIDNQDKGKTGNLSAEINSDNGILKQAIRVASDNGGMITVFSHPKTGIPFEGFNIPLWDNVCTLARETSLKFLPLRIIGWDIAVTPNGPFVVEGNFLADPPSCYKNMDIILSKIYEFENQL